MKIAAIQMVSGPRVADNLARAQALLEAAAAAGAELAVLPEYFGFIGDDAHKLGVAEPWGCGPMQDFLQRSARTLGLWIVGGSLPVQTAQAGRATNSSLVFDPGGHVRARYDKLHLFRFDDGERRYDEAATLDAGAQAVCFDLPSRDGHTWRVGLSICYDLRFPELYRAYAEAGCTLLTAPSAFTALTGQAHWDLLTRTRAVENLCGLVAAAQGGRHENGRRTWGHSRLVDAWGRVLADAAEGEAVVLAELELPALRATRQRLDALAHRRPASVLRVARAQEPMTGELQK
jgi:nitrilase